MMLVTLIIYTAGFRSIVFISCTAKSLIPPFHVVTHKVTCEVHVFCADLQRFGTVCMMKVQNIHQITHVKLQHLIFDLYTLAI